MSIIEINSLIQLATQTARQKQNLISNEQHQKASKPAQHRNEISSFLLLCHKHKKIKKVEWSIRMLHDVYDD